MKHTDDLHSTAILPAPAIRRPASPAPTTPELPHDPSWLHELEEAPEPEPEPAAPAPPAPPFDPPRRIGLGRRWAYRAATGRAARRSPGHPLGWLRRL